MTIMTQGNSEGTRRCDGTCHKARHDRCTCICGGRYHGKGKAAQELLTRDWLGDNWRDAKATIEAAGGSFEVVVQKAINATVAAVQFESVHQARLPIEPERAS